MSDNETPSNRSHAPSRSEERERSKKRSKGKTKRAKTPEYHQAFMESDEFSNVVIKVAGGKQVYANDCILTYFSPVLKDKLKPDNAGGGKGKGKQSRSADKELDWSDKSCPDVIKLMEYIDPREDCEITDDDAIRLAPLAKEFQMQTLLKICERTLTQSFYQKRKSRRLTMDTILSNLEVADSNHFQELNRMCVDACVANSNPYVNKSITTSPRISDETKILILEKKLSRVHMRKPQESGRISSQQ